MRIKRAGLLDFLAYHVGHGRPGAPLLTRFARSSTRRSGRAASLDGRAAT
jgi:hypothetical protein